MMEAQAIADVRLLRTEEGGRRGPTPPQWFSCVLKIAGGNHDARLRLDGSLELGVRSQVAIVFLDGSTAKRFLKQDMPFDLWDGKVIGHGRVTEVVEDTAGASNSSERRRA